MVFHLISLIDFCVFSIFEAIINGIIFLISFLVGLLLTYRNAIDVYVLIKCLVIFAEFSNYHYKSSGRTFGSCI